MEPPSIPPPPPPQPPAAPITPASPFDPTRTAARPPGNVGCGKPVIIGCGVLLLALGIGFILLLYNAGRLVQWSFRQLEAQVLAQLPQDVTAEERERLQKAFGDAIAAVQAGRIAQEKFQEVQFKMFEIARKGGNLTRQDILELTEALEAAAGKTRDSPASSETTGPAPPG